MIEQISTKNLDEANAFLVRYEETAQFLINNLKAHGPSMTDHHNSGNFKLIRKSGSVVGVFCLARRGNLMVQAEAVEPKLVLDACNNESVPIKGFIGDWNSVEPVYRLFSVLNPSYKPSYESKEILYSYLLTSGDSKITRDPRVRLLLSGDFSQWLEFSIAYMTELSLPDELTAEQKKKDFENQTRNKVWWGLFEGQTLLSRTALNSKGDKIGQVGGVFTPKELRKKGYAKAVMFHMLKDCIDLHGHTKSILFTGETDFPAQKLYESMGYKRIGSFALVLGN